MMNISAVSADVLTLSDGLRLSIENSRVLKMAGYEEAISEADTIVSKSKMLPTINVSLGQTSLAYQPAAIFGSETVPVSEKNFLSYSLSIQQTLYDFRGNASKYEASKMLLNTRKLDTLRIKNLVAIDFVLIYLELLESEKMLMVAEKEVERLESHLRNAKSMYEEGVITKNDLLQAEVRISDARQKHLSAKNLRAITASRLNNAIQRPLNAEIQVMDIQSASSDLPDMEIEKAWETAVSQRAEIKIVDETLKSLGLEEKSRRSEYFPRLFVKGGYDYTENQYQLYQGNWSLTLGMNINLFSGGSTRAEVSKIENQQMKLLEQRSKLTDEIKVEVEKYMLEAKTAKERVYMATGVVQQAEENLRINRLKYEEGIGTATDVLDAVSLLTIAETNFYRSLYDLRKSEAAVLYSIGKEISEVYK